jgi:D-glycero-D-manno-heptose 1,7-bisphosphate phosphatase
MLPGVPKALLTLADAGFHLVVFSNQAIVARGLASEDQVRALNAHIQGLLSAAGGPMIRAWYFCPHHPNATLDAYRLDCNCRKPRPGLILSAARDLDLDLSRSWAVGDRMTDVIAGIRAGCRTVLVETGRHADAPIETTETLDLSMRPDHTCPDLPSAVVWMLRSSRRAAERAEEK